MDGKRSGFDALAELDFDGDGAITASDPRWGELRLWQDHDHDGRASDDELIALHGAEIGALGVTTQWNGRRDAFGNQLRWKATVTFAREERVTRRPDYDVYFVELE